MSQQERMFVFFKGLKLFRPQKEGIGNMSFKSLAEAIRMASQPLRGAPAAAVGFILELSSSIVAQAHSAQIAADFPNIITCEYKGMTHAFYLSRVDADGLATYITPSRRAGTISVEGTAKALGESIGGSCLGKTIQELRASGQAHDLSR